MTARLRRLFVVPVSSVITATSWRVTAAGSSGTKEVTGPGASSQGGVSVFITPESLSSFSGAAVVVGILAEFLVRVFYFNRDVTVVVMSLIVGGVIFALSVEEPGSRPKTFVRWLVAVIIGILNSLLLAAAVEGVSAHVLNKP